MSTADRVKKVLLENCLKDVSSSEIKSDTLLIEYGVGLDSVAMLELLVALEQEFRIQIDESEINPEIFETIGTISDYISKIS